MALKKIKLIYLCIFLVILVVMLPVCFADEIKATDGVTLKTSNDSTNTSKNANVSSVQSSSITNAFPGLAAWLVVIITPLVSYIAVGAAVILVGYVIYRAGFSAWTYYHAYSYSSLSEHAYNHINDFPNIWENMPPRKDFEKKCKDNMNSKSVERYIDITNGNSIAFNPSTEMMTAGNTDGKTIDTCTRYKRSDVDKKLMSEVWKRLE